MSALTIRSAAAPDTVITRLDDPATIAAELQAAGIRFEQWQTDVAVEPGMSQDQVIAAYRPQIDRLIAEEGYQTVDVISLAPDHPNKDALRRKFWQEHTHSEDEVRFFVAGAGLFTLHIGERIYEAYCEAGDFISVPAGTPHWFDMGTQPAFVCIRLFNDPSGWVAQPTGSDLAEHCTRLD